MDNQYFVKCYFRIVSWYYYVFCDEIKKQHQNFINF